MDRLILPLIRLSKRRHAGPSCNSEVVLDEWQGSEHLNIIFIGLHYLHGLWSFGHSLAHYALALELGIPLLLIVLLDALQEGLVAPRLPHVLDAHMDALPKLAVPDDLGHLNPQCISVHVEDHPSPAMIEGERHALLDGWIYH